MNKQNNIDIKKNTFFSYIDNLFSDISDTNITHNINSIKTELKKLPDNTFLYIINNIDEIKKKFENDNLEFKKLKIYLENNNIKYNWNKLELNINKLLAILLLKKLNNNDYNKFIYSINSHFENKIKLYNDLLEEQLFNKNESMSGGYFNKYLKYKIKYLMIK